MDKRRIIYIGVLLILTVILSVTYFSYAFFTSRIEQHGKLNLVAGTLEYKIESNDLINNSITLNANTTKVIEIKVTSLNNINSKYELYYTTTNDEIVVGYSSDNDSPSGKISANEGKTITIVIKNKASSSSTITFGIQGGFNSNELVLVTGTSITEVIDIGSCDYATGYVWDFPFDPDGDGIGQEQSFTVPCDGTYQLEVWGAQGGTYGSYTGGYGGYSVGVINLNIHDMLYVNAGGAGSCRNGKAGSSDCASVAKAAGGYNGGGSSQPCDYTNACSGGGATHIATSTGTIDAFSSKLDDLLIVAGGGGGGGYNTYYAKGNSGGPGGGAFGTSSSLLSTSFGQAQNGGAYSAGGGGGYYGGSGSVSYVRASTPKAGGGSGYIAPSNLVSTSDIRKAMYCYGCTEATNTETDTEIFTVSTTGSSSYRDTTNCPNGYSEDAISKCAKAGNGHARITYIGE